MKKLKWTVEFSVSENWIEDGFDITDERAKEMLRGYLRFAYNSEIAARVISRPSPELIKEMRGY